MRNDETEAPAQGDSASPTIIFIPRVMLPPVRQWLSQEEVERARPWADAIQRGRDLGWHGELILP